MFDKLKEAIIRKVIEKYYPDRDMTPLKVGNQFFIGVRDSVGCDDYLLKGTYNYNQVVELNNMTGYNASFGFCKEIGPVAFIGIPNHECTKYSGYFKNKIHGYGDNFDESEYYFEHFSDEEAKGIGNYTVYGMMDPSVLENKAPIDNLCYVYDYRYRCKDESNEYFHRGVLRMDVKLKGTYSFDEARILAYGSKKKPDGYTGDQVPLQFAIVGDNQPVGIMDMWKQYDGSKFCDVQGRFDDVPEEQNIRFISDEEAKELKDFTLYYFRAPYSFDRNDKRIEKIDRTLEKGFNFIMEDGTDYRLQTPGKTNNKVLNKKITG